MEFQVPALLQAMAEAEIENPYQLHLKTGLSTSTTHDILINGHEPSLRTVKKLAQSFGKDPLFFYTPVFHKNEKAS